MSAGRDLVPGIRVGTSFRGAGAADWAAAKRASRIATPSVDSVIPLHDLTRVLKQASSIRLESDFCRRGTSSKEHQVVI